ncbi:hypothetical protein JCM10213v2_001380 [Rhodosporidiobolus nylandii]
MPAGIHKDAKVSGKLWGYYLQNILNGLTGRPRDLREVTRYTVDRAALKDSIKALNTFNHARQEETNDWKSRLPEEAVVEYLLNPNKITLCIEAAGKLATSGVDWTADFKILGKDVWRKPEFVALVEQYALGEILHPLNYSLPIAILGLEQGVKDYSETPKAEEKLANALYRTLEKPFADAEQKQLACLKRLRLQAVLFHKRPELATSNAFEPAPYLKLLEPPAPPTAAVEHSIFKPQIARRHVAMYFPGGTKRGWEKAHPRF